MENYYVKIQGKANIPSALSIGHNYRLTADCSITSESKSDNEESFLAQANISSFRNFLDGIPSFESGSVLDVNLLSNESSNGIFARDR
jgi:hypothetical protein